MRKYLAIARFLTAACCGAASMGLMPAAPGANASAPAGGAQKKSPKATLFLIFGTAFTDEGFALPNAEVRVRRYKESKVRWTATSNTRGEFSVRVPPDGSYDVSVKAKGFEEQTKTVNAVPAGREDIVFRLKRTAGGKQK